jgi:hypothetical protein
MTYKTEAQVRSISAVGQSMTPKIMAGRFLPSDAARGAVTAIYAAYEPLPGQDPLHLTVGRDGEILGMEWAVMNPDGSIARTQPLSHDEAPATVFLEAARAAKERWENPPMTAAQTGTIHILTVGLRATNVVARESKELPGGLVVTLEDVSSRRTLGSAAVVTVDSDGEVVRVQLAHTIEAGSGGIDTTDETDHPYGDRVRSIIAAARA